METIQSRLETFVPAFNSTLYSQEMNSQCRAAKTETTIPTAPTRQTKPLWQKERGTIGETNGAFSNDEGPSSSEDNGAANFTEPSA